MQSVALIQAIAVTAELCGRAFSPEAAAVFCDDLDGFDEAQVMVALRRCRREVRGMLTVQDVVSRIDDGRPGPDEAWAMIPKTEDESVVWSAEMQVAYAAARPALLEGDKMAARLAFREAYIAAVNRARDQRIAPSWQPSLGLSLHGRASVLEQAAQLGRISHEAAREHLPDAGDALGIGRSVNLRIAA